MKFFGKMFYVLMAVLLIGSFSGCFDKLDIRNFADAKLAITKAQNVKADKYAPEEIKAARDKLYAAHEQVKKEEYDKSRDLANESEKKAIEAYNKSIPLLAKDTIDIADKSLASATDAYAEVMAKDEYTQAKDTLKKAQEQYEGKQYYEAYQSALEADKQAKNARNIALGKKGTLKDAIDEVNMTLATAKKYNADKYAPEKVKLAQDNLKVAGDSLDGMNLKQGFAAVEVAKVNADEAYLTALKQSAADEVKNAEELTAKAEKSEGAAAAKSEMNGAKESLASAKALLAEGKYKESIAASEEAKRLSALVLSAKPAVKEDDEAGKFGKGKEKKEDKELSDEEKGYRIYKVKYVPKNRDCLWKIAKKYYKDGHKWKLIYNANKDKIKKPTLIQPGWKLKIPFEKKGDVKTDEGAVEEKKAEEKKIDEKKPEEEKKAGEGDNPGF